MRTFICTVFPTLLSFNYSYADLTSAIVAEVKPRELKLDFSTVEKCAKGVEDARAVKLVSLGGVSASWLVGYMVTQKALVHKIAELEQTIKFLGNVDTGLAGDAAFIERKRAAVMAFQKEVGDLNMLMKVLSEQGEGVADRKFMKALEAEMDTINRAAVKIHGANLDLTNATKNRIAIDALKVQTEAVGTIKNLLTAASKQIADNVTSLRASAARMTSKVALFTHAPKVLGALTGLVALGFDLVFHTSEAVTSTLSERMATDENLFNNKVSAKDICVIIRNGDQKDRDLVMQKISGILATAKAEDEAREKVTAPNKYQNVPVAQ